MFPFLAGRCLANPPTVGYSAQALAGRITILEGAHETLASAHKRRDYDDRFQLGEVSEDVPSEYVAGTLILLQESGNAQTVVAVGEAWLATHRHHRSARDVALVTALAHCDLATSHLEAHGTLEQACEMLSVALKLLLQYRAGTSELQDEIRGAARELQPQLALELLARSDDAPARARGLDLLPSALETLATSTKTEERRRGELSRKQFLDSLRPLLSAEEHCRLFATAGPSYAASPAELYNAAIAHISAGCASSKPSIIRRALEILTDAETVDAETEVSSTSSTSAISIDAPPAIRDRRISDERHRRAVASCVASLLLGDSGAAGDALGLRDGSLKCDRQVFAFIKANSPDAATLLPGVCALVERWVKNVALNAYVSDSGVETDFSLDSWFENPHVVRELEASGNRPFALLGRLLATPLSAISGLFTMPAAREEEEEEEHIAASRHLRDEEGKEEEAADTNSGPEIVTATREQVREAQSSGVAALKPSAPALQQLSFEEKLAAEAADFLEDDADYDDGTENFLSQPIALEAIKPLLGEDAWMRRAYQARRIRWERLAGAGAIIVGGVALAMSAALPALTPDALGPVPQSRPDAVPVPGGKILSRGEAASLVSKWQRVKAAALGPKHAVGGLSTVLRGDLLHQWQERSTQLETKGWHYTHTLHSCKIVEVAPGRAPGTAVVIVSMKEGVAVHKGSDVDPQTFTSEYQVVYQVEYENNGGWLLTGAVVQGPSTN